MFKSKKTIVIFMLMSMYVATDRCADSISTQELNTMLLHQYDHGENRHFHPEMSCCERYAAYARLCYALECHVPEQGRKAIEQYINSQKITCDGTEINEKNFGPQSAHMIETIKNKQQDDLHLYYIQRAENNPERTCLEAIYRCPSTLCCTVICAAYIPFDCRKKHLNDLIFSRDQIKTFQVFGPPSHLVDIDQLDTSLIDQFIRAQSIYPLSAVTCLGISLLCCLERTANL